MNIKFNLTQKKDTIGIAVRLYFKKLDISSNLPMFLLSEKEWDSDSQCFKNDNESNEILLKLKLDILKAFNKDFAKGLLINSNWLKNIISESFNRPSAEVSLQNLDRDLYFYDFARFWVDNYSGTWKTDHKNTMSKVLVSQYKKFVEIFGYFQKECKTRFLLSDISVDDVYLFVNYMEDLSYNNSTIERYIGRLKFMMNRAADFSLKVSPIAGQRIYIEKEDQDIEGVYLNEEEILKVYTTDVSFDSKLQIVKDNFLIGAFTGLRVSDFLNRLDTSNIKDNLITITTKKTKTKVVIPVHKIVKEILDKNFGLLPPKISEYEFNKSLKVLVQIAEIDNLVYGKKWNPEKKRKEKGYFKKYELVSSHICRRSFVSILYGKVPNDTLMSILGWSSEKMLLHYVCVTKQEQAEVLEKHWNTKN